MEHESKRKDKLMGPEERMGMMEKGRKIKERKMEKGWEFTVRTSN